MNHSEYKKVIVFFSILVSLWMSTVFHIVYAQPTISSITDNRAIYTSGQIPKYSKLEIKFEVPNSTAGNNFLPYSATLPSGMDPSYTKHKGITVDAIFSNDNFVSSYRQPAFFAKEYEYRDTSGNLIMKDSKQWRYPTGKSYWFVRFAPNKTGTWQYKLTATDSSGTVTSSATSFTVVESTSHGFVKVSAKDKRYFEFDDGTPFLFQGISSQANRQNVPAEYQKYKQSGINFIREWWSGNYGTSWGEWTLGNDYIQNSYLPKSMLFPKVNPSDSRQILTTRIDYNSENTADTNDDGRDGWFDACIVEDTEDYGVLQNKTYKYEITYVADGITGPRVSGKPFGVVGKLDNGGQSWSCWESTNGQVITNYGSNTTTYTTIAGTYRSGSANFLPRLMVGLENVTKGTAYIYSTSLKEDLGNGTFGPEILGQSNSDFHLYSSDFKNVDADIRLEEAAKNDLYLKVVLMEKEDKMWKKINNDGSLTINMGDNTNGFYGTGRNENMTRYLQAAWFRYSQARWGYSTNLHSFELINEGDPGNSNHFKLADEMGKYLRCRVFGIPVPFTDGAVCNSNQPDAHMTTTSFWHSFPMNELWANPQTPNVSYADLHAYNSTSQLPATDCDKTISQNDAAYYHLCHSKAYSIWGANSNLNKPVVRGEAGMDKPDSQCTNCIGIENDTNGVWLQTYLWSTLDNGGLYEMYWWYKEHITNSKFDNGTKYKVLNTFLAGIPLANGNYKDVDATVSDTNLQVVGQKDIVSGNAHMWIRNKNFTWKNKVNNVTLSSVTGTVSISGFKPGSYTLEKWDTKNGALTATTTITADTSGKITLSIQNLSEDTAYKIRNPSIVPSNSPTPTTTLSQPCPLKGDTSTCDGKVNILDYTYLSGKIGTSDRGADLDGSGAVNILDYTILSNNFGKP